MLRPVVAVRAIPVVMKICYKLLRKKDDMPGYASGNPRTKISLAPRKLLGDPVLAFGLRFVFGNLSFFLFNLI
jgi:hypothetical protein